MQGTEGEGSELYSVPQNSTTPHPGATDSSAHCFFQHSVPTLSIPEGDSEHHKANFAQVIFV